MSIESVMPSNHLILCHPLLLLPSVFPSIRIFSSESALRIRWPKYWSFSFSISPSNEYSVLISFRIDWFDLLAVQGTCKSLLQHHSSKSINSSALSFLYGPTLTFIHDYWKAIAFTRQTFVSRNEWQTALVFLPWEPHEQYEKAKKISHGYFNISHLKVSQLLKAWLPAYLRKWNNKNRWGLENCHFLMMMKILLTGHNWSNKAITM